MRQEHARFRKPARNSSSACMASGCWAKICHHRRHQQARAGYNDIMVKRNGFSVPSRFTNWYTPGWDALRNVFSDSGLMATGESSGAPAGVQPQAHILPVRQPEHIEGVIFPTVFITFRGIHKSWV